MAEADEDLRRLKAAKDHLKRLHSRAIHTFKKWIDEGHDEKTRKPLCELMESAGARHKVARATRETKFPDVHPHGLQGTHVEPKGWHPLL